MSFWYAAFVKTGDEDNVRERLGYIFSDDIGVFVPKREIYERKEGKLNLKVKVLFPGYVFMNGVVEDRHIRQMHDVPNIYNLLMDDQKMTVIPEDEINVFRHLMIDDVIGISNAIVENDEIVIVDGPLLALKGKIIRIDKRKGRAKVGIEFLGQYKVVDLGINVMVKAE